MGRNRIDEFNIARRCYCLVTRILAVYPHPDDETFGKAGTFIQHVESGDIVTLICATMGQMGRRMGHPFFANRETLTEIRKNELIKACEAIGIKDIRMWMLQDKTLQFRDVSFMAGKIKKVIKELKPKILYSYYPEYGVHPDHNALSAAAALAIAELPKAEQPLFYGSAISTNHLDVLGKADIVNDVSDVMEKKMKALRAHRSQSEFIILPLEGKVKIEQAQKERLMKSLTWERFWVYPVKK
jgi:bacillithiol biosynthesis deacetylase BshB2